MRRALLLAAVLVLPACVSGNYQRTRTFQRPDDAALTGLAPGASDLAECLDALGAPLLVREDRDGAVLAWGWEKNQNWTATVSLPVTDDQSFSLSYNDIDQRLRGVVAFFDASWQVTELRRGQLSELLPERRARPQVVE